MTRSENRKLSSRRKLLLPAWAALPMFGSVSLLCAGTDVKPIAPPAPATALPQPTDELLVFLNPGSDAGAVARQFGLALSRSLAGESQAVVLKAGSPAAAEHVLAALTRDGRVKSAYVNQRTAYSLFSFVPNDPYFHRDTPTAGFNGQWHLLNEYVAGRDARVQGAWNHDYTGAGVTIGIVDDSLEIAHPDLAPNYVSADSFDFGQNDSNPNPVHANDQHGISVAGVAAARGNNSIGVTGAAPFAGLAGLRIDFPGQTTAMFVDATLYHSSGANTAIRIKNHSYGYSANYILTQAERAALATSVASGTVHIFAAGNDRNQMAEDSNKKHAQNSPDAIAVAAFGSDGKFASYSCFGSNVFVTAPSNSGTGFTGITTTDRTTESAGYNGGADSFPNGDYTTQFGGTSSASPLVAGVMALVKQVQPALNTRLAKHLLVRTSDVVDAGDVSATSDGGWKTNAAGFKFNENYGFGLIDAEELTRVAVQYSGVNSLTTTTVPTTSVAAAIPDNNTTGVSRTFAIASTTSLEEVMVTLSITHTFRGDLQAFLTSPSGLTSRLAYRSGADSTDNINWTFLTNAFWGENPAGTWTIKVNDVFSVDTGTWNNYSVALRQGSPVLFDQWAGPGGGSFNTNANWTNTAVPNAIGATANFLTRTGFTPASITLSSPVTVGTVKFYNPDAAYTIGGSSSLTLDVASGSAQINDAHGSHAINAPVILNDNATVHVANTADTLTLSNLTMTGQSLTKTGLGKLAVDKLRGTSATISAGKISVVFSGTGEAGDITKTSRLTTLTITSGATLDLNNNDLIITGMSYSAVEPLVIAGFNGFNWLGTGITSSTAAATSARMLGIVNNANTNYTTFNGETVSGTDVLVKYTYLGDANLDGLVSPDDFTLFINGFAGGTAMWSRGDFDYNGFVNPDDFTLFVNGVGAFNASGGQQLSEEFKSQLANFATSSGFPLVLPEPGMLAPLAMAGLLARRRHRRRA